MRNALTGSFVLLGFALAVSCGDSDSGGATGSGGSNQGGSAGKGGASGSSGSSGQSGKGGSSGSSGAAGKGGSAGNAGTAGSAGSSGSPAGGSSGDSGASAGGSAGDGDAGQGGNPEAGAGGEGGTPDPPDPPVVCPTPANFAAEYAGYICAKNAECCTGTATGTCVQRATDGLNAIYPNLAAAIAASEASFDCDAYIACVNEINDVICELWPKEGSPELGVPVAPSAMPDACRNIVQGLIASGDGSDGNACTEHYTCNGGHCTDPDAVLGQVQQCISYRGSSQTCRLPTSMQLDAATLQCNPETHYCSAANDSSVGNCFAKVLNGGNCSSAIMCQSRECAGTPGSMECVVPATCEHIPTAPSGCSISHPGSAPSSAAWLAVAGLFAAAAGARRRRR